MEKRFVILSLARSGTSLLGSTLHTHPAILCHGEVFHPSPKFHLRGNLAPLTEDEQRVVQTQPDYLDRIFNQDRPVVGFKMWHKQNPGVCEALMADETVYKIIYERENALAVFASGHLARETGVWNTAPTAKLDFENLPDLKFSPEFFDKYIKTQKQAFDLYRKMSRGPVLNLTYRDIVAGRFDLVLDFLGQEQVPLTPQKKKLHSSDIISRYAPMYRDQIADHLRAIGHPEWARE